MEVEEAAEVEVVVEASPKLEEGEVGQAREDILKEVEEAVAEVAVEVVSLVVEALLVEEVEGGCFFYFTILNILSDLSKIVVYSCHAISDSCFQT